MQDLPNKPWLWPVVLTATVVQSVLAGLQCSAGDPEDRWTHSLFASNFAEEVADDPPLITLDPVDEPTYSTRFGIPVNGAFRLVGEARSWSLPDRVTQASSQIYVPEYSWELLPEGLLWHGYLAGVKEPRSAAVWLWDHDRGLFWETALGGRWGIVRHGTPGTINPEGFQLDFEGAGLARVDLEEESDLEAADFRIGIIGTWRQGPWRMKAGYVHISSHIGDEYLIKNPTFVRRNYVRDSLVAGLMYDLAEELQVYGELGYAANANGGAEPLEAQFGAQFLTQYPTGPKGFPFAAVNMQYREEFAGELATSIEAGWMWRGKRSNHIFRIGFQHYNGRSIQYSLYDRYENANGLGIWFDY